MVLSSGLGWLSLLWRVDPDSCRDLWWFWALANEPLRRAEKCCIESVLAGCVDCVGLPEVDLIWRHQADTCVVMVFVIPSEEVTAEGAGRVDALEPFREFWMIFQCLEVGFREGVVIRGMRYAVGCGI